jgi:hypothetical protein
MQTPHTARHESFYDRPFTLAELSKLLGVPMADLRAHVRLGHLETHDWCSNMPPVVWSQDAEAFFRFLEARGYPHTAL